MPADDRYTIPDSGGVLRNKLGLTTQDAVDRAMNIAASTEWAILATEPIPDELDLDYLCSIHRRLLSPVLDWAGEMRLPGDEAMATGTGFVYARSDFYRTGVDEVFGALKRENYLRGLSAHDFATTLAERWGYLTLTHPFRDGNTRTQSAYVDRLAIRAGHPIDWELVDVPTLRSLRLAAASGTEGPLAEYLESVLAPPTTVRVGEISIMRGNLMFTVAKAAGRESTATGGFARGVERISSTYPGGIYVVRTGPDEPASDEPES